MPKQHFHAPSRPLALLIPVLFAFVFVAVAAPAALAVTAPLVINEIDYDQPSTDTAEFVELKNVSAGGINLDDFTVELVNGTGGGAVIYQTVGLPNVTLAAGDYYVICANAATVVNCDLDVAPDTNLIQNGAPDAVGLRWSGTLVDAVSYEGDSGAPYTEGSGAGLSDSSSIAGSGISRCPDGADTGTNNQDFVPRSITPGAANDCPTIMQIQGAGHLSPHAGASVGNVPGIVTAVTGNGFYMQDPAGDGDIATSDGIFVFTGSPPTVGVGDSLLVDGTVDEFYPGGFATGNLSTTELTSPTLTVISPGNPVPAPTVLGYGGRIPPDTVIDDDATGDVETTGSFDPALDGIDFYESLEAMLVQVNDGVAVGPTSAFGETAIVGDNGANAALRSPRGGLVVQPGDFNPERIILDDALLPYPDVDVGARFPDPVVGVFDYSFGNFKLLVTGLTTQPSSLQPETTDAVSAGELSVAAFNVVNLDALDDVNRFLALASQIVDRLRSPDIFGVVGIQDSTGQVNDGVVDAGLTYTTLITAIQVIGGPTYGYRDIAPLDNQDGGQPGANTRVGFLFRPDRVAFVDRPGGDATTPTSVAFGPSGVELSSSPGRIEPANPAFVGNRKPLAGEFRFGGDKVFVIVTHFNSKGGDDPLFGRVQPPVPYSEAMRVQQAQVVNDFVDDILALDPGANVMVLGDQNDFQFSTALDALAGGVLTNLIDTLPVEEQYNFLFDGNSEVLDNFLVSDHIADTTPAFDIVHVNAEWAAADQATSHDPMVGRFCLDTVPPAVTITQPSRDVTGLSPVSIPIRVEFTSSDDSGTIAHELIELQDCVIYDGDTYGDGDGLLSDEGIQLNKYKLCQFMSQCRYTILYYPTIRVKAEDACGNTGTAERIIRRRLLRSEVCGR